SENAANKEAAFQINCRKYNLSARETEVLRLVLDGNTYAAVAAALFISKKTVDTHMQNIYDKVGVRSRYALIILFYAV
ncbi:MAG: helix-turn-helix transcriptional regulator, partial [Bacteroidetes bacterium]|nr:helix-turn-helix transcriptional regulator [Bacteroidota bacterium]